MENKLPSIAYSPDNSSAKNYQNWGKYVEVMFFETQCTLLTSTSRQNTVVYKTQSKCRLSHEVRWTFLQNDSTIKIYLKVYDGLQDVTAKRFRKMNKQTTNNEWRKNLCSKEETVKLGMQRTADWDGCG